MDYYLIALLYKDSMEYAGSTICRSKAQMETLVKNIDNEKYIIDNITRVYNCKDMVDFLKKNEGIETGKKEGSDVN